MSPHVETSTVSV
ncbi:hypothetical protein CP8484711_0984A, partial [Chlamydia psittaci 84-8471/1]